ncbi:MAG: siphovirus ReqiPepy6 Gp37-like family protein [Bacillota bacterium]|nr:siphovirus ReqiPepy6 Gp37-like family protein [Bacillota bacterium]
MDVEVKTIRFYDPDLNFLKEMDEFSGVIYRSKWHTYGSFEFFFSERLPCMEKDNLVIFDYDTRKNGIIKHINCTEEGVTLKGYSLPWMLTGRLALPPAGKEYDVLSGSYEDCIYALVEHNAISPADPKRKLPLWECRESLHRGGNCKYQARHTVVMDCITELSKVSGLGIGAEIDLKRKKIIFEVREGMDRTAQQKERPHVIFSDVHENVTNREYTLDDTESRNCAYVAGQGEGAARIVITVGDEFTGRDRMEVFIDARDIEDAAQLPERGKTKLAAMLPRESYTSDVCAGYKAKWDIGDFVTALDEEYSITMMKQILEVEESQDESGYIVTPVLGIPEKQIGETEGSSGAVESGGGGSGDITYIHTHLTAEKVWDIRHNLNKYPSVTVVDSAGNTVLGECEYLSKDQIRLQFSAAFAGLAYLN